MRAALCAFASFGLVVSLAGCTSDFDQFDVSGAPAGAGGAGGPGVDGSVAGSAGSAGGGSGAGGWAGGAAGQDASQAGAAPDGASGAGSGGAPDMDASDAATEVASDAKPEASDAAQEHDSGCPPNHKPCKGGVCWPITDPLHGCAAPSCEPCNLPHAFEVCGAQGECEVASCEAEWKDCDQKDPNGCEVRLPEDPHNCGECGKQCPQGFDCSAWLCKCKGDPSCDAGSTGNCLGSGVCKCGNNQVCAHGQRCVAGGGCG
jgi:hypothetical protein